MRLRIPRAIVARYGLGKIRSKDSADAFAVAGDSASSSSKIYPEAHDATPSRNSGAYIGKEDKSEENDPAKRDSIGYAHRFQR